MGAVGEVPFLDGGRLIVLVVMALVRVGHEDVFEIILILRLLGPHLLQVNVSLHKELNSLCAVPTSRVKGDVQVGRPGLVLETTGPVGEAEDGSELVVSVLSRMRSGADDGEVDTVPQTTDTVPDDGVDLGPLVKLGIAKGDGGILDPPDVLV